MLFRSKPDEAIRCFEIAYELVPELDNEQNHVRFWFSQALLATGREEDALAQVERGLRRYPDDVYLLNQKALVLSQLARKSPAYEDEAVEFLTFRASAMPRDYFGLSELIEIFERRGCPEKASRGIWIAVRSRSERLRGGPVFRSVTSALASSMSGCSICSDGSTPSRINSSKCTSTACVRTKPR